MNKIIIILLMFFVCCDEARMTQTNPAQQGDINSYKVYKIDSINNYFLIYVRKKDSVYKIVSHKENMAGCEKIKKEGSYNLKLHSQFENASIAGHKILQQNSLLVNCFMFDDSTKICLERDSINDLYIAENIKGLCIISK